MSQAVSEDASPKQVASSAAPAPEAVTEASAEASTSTEASASPASLLPSLEAEPLRALEASRIIDTIGQLERRIAARLPGRNLVNIAKSLKAIAEQAAERSEQFRKPNIPLRIVSATLVAVILGSLIAAKSQLRFTDADAWTMLEGIDAGVSSLVLLGAAVLFLITIEQRIKRKKALDAVQELRVLAHIIDMHQLAKDPERTLHPGEETDASPKRDLSPFLLSRYLDYCSEMLSLIGKVAVVYIQGYQDPVVLAAVDEVEDLTTGLSRKIWQKIMILDQVLESEHASIRARAAETKDKDG